MATDGGKIRDTVEFKPHMYATPPDGSGNKAFPNGLRVLFAAIWQRWAILDREIEGPSTSAKEFAEEVGLREIAASLREKYPFSPPPPGFKDGKNATAKAGEEFQYYGGSKLKDRQSIKLDYMALRRAAEVVGLPLGLLVLFSNFVSLERRSEKRVRSGEIESKREELLKLSIKIERFGREAREIIAKCNDQDEIFYTSYGPGEWTKPSGNEPNPDEEAYLADLEVLKRLRDACKVG